MEECFVVGKSTGRANMAVICKGQRPAHREVKLAMLSSSRKEGNLHRLEMFGMRRIAIWQMDLGVGANNG